MKTVKFKSLEKLYEYGTIIERLLQIDITKWL